MENVKVISAKQKQTYDTEENWKVNNPVLLAGQLGYVQDKYGKYKIGDGTTHWNDLDYADNTFIGTKAEYEEKNASGGISEGTVVCITDDNDYMNIPVDTELSETSENIVENRAIKKEFGKVLYKSGGTVTGDMVLEKDYQVHHADAGAGNNGFIIIAQIKITHAYSDSPLQLTIFRRGCRPTELYIRFISANTLTPGLQDFVYTGDDCKAYIVQLSPGVWALYISKTEACDNIAVVSAKYNHAYGFPEIIWKNDFAGSVTGGGRYASYYPVLQSKYIIDSDDNIPINITFNKAGQASTDWLASWNEHELGSISPKNIAAGKVFDYGNTSKLISIGYAGTGLNSGNATHFAAYTESGTKIKDLSPGEARKLISAMGLKNANGYYGMTDINGTDSVWIRTTTQGIIPYQGGNRGGGHQSLGTNSWFFSKSYIDYMYAIALDLSGTFTTSTTTGTYINGAKGTNVIINSTASGNGYNILAKMNSYNGVFTIGCYQGAIRLYYISNGFINTNLNSFNTELILLNESGNTSFPGTVSASSFSAGGSSSLTTLTATNATINGNLIFGNVYLTKDGGNYFDIRFNNSTTVGVGYHFYSGSDNMWLVPLKDNKAYLGASDAHWVQIYCTNAAISTSDAREKKEISYIGKESGYEDTYMSDETLVKFINGLMACIFKRKNGESGRPHHGFIAQDVENLMQILGIKDHAGFIKSPKTIDKETEKEVINDEGNKEIVKEMIKEEIPGEYIYGLRYEEFISDIVRYCQILYNKNGELKNTQQIQQEKIDSLETRLSLLENKLDKLLNQ